MSSVRVRWLTWVVVLHPTANLLGGDETDELYEAFKSAVAQHYQGVVINLSDIGLINSSGVGVLAGLRVRAERFGAKTRAAVRPRLSRDGWGRIARNS